MFFSFIKITKNTCIKNIKQQYSFTVKEMVYVTMSNFNSVILYVYVLTTTKTRH